MQDQILTAAGRRARPRLADRRGAAGRDGGPPGPPDPAGRQRDQDRRPELHRPRPRRRLPADRRDRREPGAPQDDHRHRRRHARPPRLQRRSRPRHADRRAQRPRHLRQHAERPHAPLPAGQARHPLHRAGAVRPAPALPGRAAGGDLLRHAALHLLAAEPRRRPHPAAPHRHRRLSRQRGLRRALDDLRQGRGRALHRRPEEGPQREVHPADHGRGAGSAGPGRRRRRAQRAGHDEERRAPALDPGHQRPEARQPDPGPRTASTSAPSSPRERRSTGGHHDGEPTSDRRRIDATTCDRC